VPPLRENLPVLSVLVTEWLWYDDAIQPGGAVGVSGVWGEGTGARRRKVDITDCGV
jgi:hypothetical protein